MNDQDLKGMYPAVILPMDKSYRPDYDAFGDYLEWLIGQKAAGFAINMDTGEGPQLSPDERRRVAEKAVEVANGRVFVLGGVMGATTGGAVETARMYAEVGVDGLVVFPNAAFRNEPLDPRIPVDYHKAIAEASGLPIVLFQLAPADGVADLGAAVEVVDDVLAVVGTHRDLPVGTTGCLAAPLLDEDGADQGDHIRIPARMLGLVE